MTVDLLDAQAPAVPHPPHRLPLLGDLLGMRPRTPIQSITETARTIGPIFERKIFNRRIVLASGPDLVADLSDEKRFGKFLSPAVAALRPIGGDGLFTAYSSEPNWRKAHNLLRPAFTQSAMRSYHQTMLDVAGELTRYWDQHAGVAPVDVSPDMTKLTLETIGRTGFSHPFDSFRRERPHPFVDAMVGALRHAQLRTFLAPPVVGDLLWRNADRRNEQRLQYMFGVVDDVIRERRESTGPRPEDLLELMMRAQREQDPDQLDDRNIRFQVITFLVAGHETTSGALSFALYYLSRHPDVLAQATAEVDAVWGTERPGFEQVAKLRYVRRVLDESLRLWPTAPVYAREAKQDTLLAGRYPMKAGDGVLVIIPALHRDPIWGPDATEFNPDRFLPEHVKGRAPHIYKPFGTGERACIGRQFAIHEAVLVLGTILQRYHIAGEPEYQLRVAERLTMLPEGFRLTLRRR
ncbi:cytochrome P450 [Skermania sp. ID1734]|uniref:cytochrome P450 n=1 Tax=Skermania sp. ID1734 TaxID=2597516 RepID=UPI00117EF7D3|nr:cytochrome P450 [Skermania sp. ID1734]TSD95686.1 cytochrome P450 [Skermania sp. ID1734]